VYEPASFAQMVADAADAAKEAVTAATPDDELEALEAVATSPRGTAPIDAFDQDAHWSQRLAMVPTHAMLAKQATKLADLKHKFKIKT